MNRDTITEYLSRTEGMVSNRTRFKIFQAVAAVNILIVAGPFIGQFLWNMIKPPPKRIMNVRMITQLPDQVSDHASSAMGGAPTPPTVTPVRRQQTTPAPPSPPPIKPVTFKPPPVAPVQPVITPKQPPVRVPPRKTARNKPKKQTQKPKPQPQQPKQPDKTFTQISDQDWQNMSRSSNSTPSTSQNREGAPSMPPGPPGDNIQGDKFMLDYSQFVAHYLKENWDTPSRIQLGGREPEVTIRLSFAPSGQIVSWQMVKPSGIAIMDTSVEKLMRFVKRIPKPPPQGLSELTLILAISD